MCPLAAFDTVPFLLLCTQSAFEQLGARHRICLSGIGLKVPKRPSAVYNVAGIKKVRHKCVPHA